MPQCPNCYRELVDTHLGRGHCMVHGEPNDRRLPPAWALDETKDAPEDKKPPRAATMRPPASCPDCPDRAPFASAGYLAQHRRWMHPVVP